VPQGCGLVTAGTSQGRDILNQNKPKEEIQSQGWKGDLKPLQGNPEVAMLSLCPPVLFGFLGFLAVCKPSSSLITITLVLVICPACVEPWEFGISLVPQHFISQPSSFLATSFPGSGSIPSGPAARAGPNTPGQRPFGR